MSTEIKSAIESLYSEMEKLNNRMSEIKKTINSLSAIIGEEQPFKEMELTLGSSSASIRNDQFFGKGLATAVKEFLKMKGRASTAQEIYEALKAGGYEFTGNKVEKIQMRNLSISLSKNSNDFVYVKSSNSYGLWEFYPEKQKERAKKKSGNNSNASEKEENGAENNKGDIQDT